MRISEIKIIYKNKTKPSIAITSSDEAYNLFMKYWDKSYIELRESLKVLYLNCANMIIGIENHSVGGVTGTIADIKLIVATALKCVASSIILAHNHPSSNLKPSKADKRLTSKVSDACDLFEIKLLDHLIVAEEGYYSFCDEDMI